MSHLADSLLHLIRATSTTLPVDVTEALLAARNIEVAGSRGQLALSTVLDNLQLAAKQQSPLCQDTGLPNFFVSLPAGESQAVLRQAIETAVQRATELGYLRPNAVNSLTEKNSGNNLGTGFPAIYFSESAADQTEISLLLKGGGSENVSDQISLPADLPDYGRAGRDLAGVQQAVLQVVKNAAGYGCAPGIISVCIGSDRAGGWATAKRGFLRSIDSTNPVPELAQLEAEILREANALGIGPQGFGGANTLLDCRVAVAHRLPASYFVTVSYLCWAARRGRIVLDREGVIIDSDLEQRSLVLDSLPQVDSGSAQLRRLHFPLSESQARELHAGDIVLVSGRIYTGRDRLHAYAATHALPRDLTDSAIYHCGPVAVQDSSGQWQFRAAGPTTSIREEPYQADFIARTSVRAVIGKGGMGDSTAAALAAHGAVYLHAIGGAAATYAAAVRQVTGVDFLEEFGVPEALWEIEVEGFLAVVTMDSHGVSLHK